MLDFSPHVAISELKYRLSTVEDVSLYGGVGTQRKISPGIKTLA